MACSMIAAVLFLVAGATVLAQDKCVQDGKSYEVGSMFDGTDAFYYCKRNGAGVKAEPIGCINNGQRVYDLALFQKGDNFYRCRAGDSSVSADLWGCAEKMPDGTVQPKSIACTWDVGTDPINYVQCCIQKGGTAVITQLYCLYTYRGGRIQVNDGCYRYFPDDKIAAGCKRNADGTTLTLKTWPAKDRTSAGQDPQATGLTECTFDKK